MLNVLGKSENRKRLVARLHGAVVARAREPVFFAGLGVPDTVDGRFDLMALHAWLLLDRLKEAGLNDLSQGLTDALFLGFDEGLRDLGAGDMGMGRRMKKLADAFYGRLHAYGASADADAMTQALQRNLYRGAADCSDRAAAVGYYAFAARAHLARADAAAGIVDFGPLPKGWVAP